MSNACRGGKQPRGDVKRGGAGWKVCEGVFLLCPVLVKAQESCYFSFWTTLQGTYAPSEDSSEESYKSKKHRKCDLHRKSEQTGSLERGRLINVTALTMDTVPAEGISADPQKAGVLSC